MAETNQSPESLGGEQSPRPADTKQPAVVQQAGHTKELDRDARMWAMFCHLAGVGGLLPIVPVLGSLIAPLVIWQIKKDDFKFVDEQGKEALNFQISILIYALAAAILCFACAGFVLAACRVHFGRRLPADCGDQSQQWRALPLSIDDPVH